MHADAGYETDRVARMNKSEDLIEVLNSLPERPPGRLGHRLTPDERAGMIAHCRPSVMRSEGVSYEEATRLCEQELDQWDSRTYTPQERVVLALANLRIYQGGEFRSFFDTANEPGTMQRLGELCAAVLDLEPTFVIASIVQAVEREGSETGAQIVHRVKT